MYTNLRPNRISAREDLGNTFYNLTTDIPLFISFKDPSNQNKWKYVLSICQIKDELSGIQSISCCQFLTLTQHLEMETESKQNNIWVQRKNSMSEFLVLHSEEVEYVLL